MVKPVTSSYTRLLFVKHILKCRSLTNMKKRTHNILVSIRSLSCRNTGKMCWSILIHMYTCFKGFYFYMKQLGKGGKYVLHTDGVVLQTRSFSIEYWGGNGAKPTLHFNFKSEAWLWPFSTKLVIDSLPAPSSLFLPVMLLVNTHSLPSSCPQF